jgi:hypothetical protein
VIICQTLAAPDNAHRKELLEVIYNLHLWRGTPQIDKQIIEGLGHLAVMSGLSMPGLAKEVALKVWQMCWHFIGPHQTKMDRLESNLVVRCADVIESLASYNCLMQQNVEVLRTTLCTAENLFDVALWYKNEKIATAVANIYREALRACESGEPKEFPLGISALRKSAKKIAKKLKSSGLKWSTVGRALLTSAKVALPSR